MEKTSRVEHISRLIVDSYRGVTITKEEYILLVTAILRQLIELLINIDPRS